MKTILACSLHICDYVAVSFMYGITLLMLSLSEMPGPIYMCLLDSVWSTSSFAWLARFFIFFSSILSWGI